MTPRGVELVPFTRADFAHLVAWVGDERGLVQWAGPIFTWPLDERQLERYLATSDGAAPQAYIWRARDAAGATVGHIELKEIDASDGNAVIARVLVDPERRGAGIGRAMVAEVLRFAFDDLGLHRVELRAFTFNVAALRCYESLGFVPEALWREVRRVGDEYWSVAGYGMLEDEWRARQQEKEGQDAI